MADRTLTINHADGDSETYTIKRDKFAGVRSMSVDGDTVTVDHTAVPKEQAKETTFGGSQSITIKREIEPLLSEVVGGASAAYSLRDLNDKAGNSKVVRVRRASDHCERDFRAKEVKDIAKWVNTQTVPPLDLQELDADGHRTGATITAAAAYSLRNLSSSYTGYVVDVRRSNDDAEVAFTAAEVADGTLTDWVNTEVVKYSSDFSSGRDGFVTTASATLDGNIDSIGGLNDNLRATSTTSLIGVNHYFRLNNIFEAGLTYQVTFDAYIPSTNSEVDDLSTVSFGTSSVDIEGQLTLDQWTSYDVTGVANSTALFLRLKRTFSGDATGDVVYIRNLQITQTTADGFVSQWYDQSGNGNHATQGTPASQPKIVSGGSLVSGGLDFDGVDDGLFTSSNLTDTIQSATIFALTQDDVTSGVASMVRIRPNGNPGNFDGFVWEKTTGDTYGGNTLFEGDNKMVSANNDGQGIRTTTENLNTLIYQPSQILAYENGTLDETLTNVRSGSAPVGDVTLVDQLWIGQNFDDNARPFNGTMSEVIIYFTDQSDNRTAIEANIGETYGIDLPSGVDTGYDQVDGFVETWYDQSGNGNDATQQVSGSQPKIVDAGSLLNKLKFEGAQFLQRAFTSPLSQPNSSFVVAQMDAGTGNTKIFDGVGSLSRNALFASNDTDFAMFAGSIQKYADRDANENLHTAIFNQDSSLGGLNGVVTSISGIGPQDAGGITIGKTHTDVETGFLTGTVSELIFYNSDQSANREAIEANINNQYDIY